MYCALCKKAAVIPPITRCKECNKIYNRVFNCTKTLDPSFLMIWDSMSKGKKDEFVKSAHEFTPFFLREKMCVAVAQELESALARWLNLTMWLASTGVFLDSKKLADRYKKEPEHLKQINFNKRWHEGVHFQSCHNAEESPTKKPSHHAIIPEDTIAISISKKSSRCKRKQLTSG